MDERIAKWQMDIEAVTKLMPELWSTCYPRIYYEPRNGSFHSAKMLALRLFEISLKIKSGYRGESELYEFQAASALAKFRVPLFFIAPNLMRALTKTATPGDIPWMTMRFPYESMAFMLPKGTLQHSEEGDIVCIGYARFQENSLDTSPFGGTYGILNGGMILFALTLDRHIFHHWNMPKDHFGETLSLRDIDDFRQALDPSDAHMGYAAIQTTEEDDLLMVRVAHYIFSALLLMTDRPEMVELGRLEKRIQKRGAAVKEFWTPNVIGGNYALRYDSGKPVGEHNSPRLHFVRGFWRHQVHGQGRLLRRLQWIEPFVRGLQTTEQTEGA